MNIKSILGLILYISYFTAVHAQTADNALLQAAQQYQQAPSTNTSETNTSSATTFIPFYQVGDSLISFEKVGAKMEAKSIGMGYGGVNSYYTVFNSPQSSVQFKRDAIPPFIITVDAGADVFELVLIVKADIAKNKTYRRFVKGGHAMGGAKDMGAYQITPELKQIDKDKYQIILPNMEQGEYAFMPIYKGTQARSLRTSAGNYRLFCFGIK